MDFVSLKADLQLKLIQEYKDYHLCMPAMPYQPDHECSFDDVYVLPRITLKSKDKDGQNFETELKTMSDIFFKNDKPFKSIYILGEAGSGKSSFCKSLISCWCKAHSDTQNPDGQKVEDYTEEHTDSIKIMKKFNFLFFLSLRNFPHKVSINDMLDAVNKNNPVLKALLEHESETCLIVLDGLDEWTSTTNVPPKRAEFSNYTVLTTSRPWKIGSIGISKNDKQQIIYINGFGDTSRIKMITNTLKILQEQDPDNKKTKDSRECEKVLSEKPLHNMTHTAMMLQLLICLWFEDKLHATSRCNIYTCMLDRFFFWYGKKDPKSLDESHYHDLPEYFEKADEDTLHNYIINDLSRLAFETLINNEKEASLTFDGSNLSISNNLKDCCLGLKILSEEKDQHLSPSGSQKSHISFIHKSVQEYLAAKHIVCEIKKKKKEKKETSEISQSSADKEIDDVSDNLSQMLKVKTLDELLEQENVLLMLCGMDTMVAKSVSKFIYNTVAKDDRVAKYRKTIYDDNKNDLFIRQIQTLILDCAEETKASSESHQFSFDLGDLVLQRFPNNPGIIGEIERNITLDSVMSFYTDTIEKGENECRTMTKCKNLERIHFEGKFDQEGYKRICDSIEVNASTLKCLSLKRHPGIRFTFGVHTSPFRHIANMTHLVALQVKGFTVTHEDFTSLCTYLSETGHLQQISIRIDCVNNDPLHYHNVDLSKHNQLQYLEYSAPIDVTNFEGANLEVIKCFSLSLRNCMKVLDFLKNSLKIKNICLQHEFSLYTSDTNLLRQKHDYNPFTSKLTRVISLSQQLFNLTLIGLTLTDNIITYPPQMKSLESIDITDVTMSLTTWKMFVDSVAELPQRVAVRAWNMCITGDGAESNPVIPIRREGGGGGEEEAAFQYVGERTASFDVDNCIENTILFVSK